MGSIRFFYETFFVVGGSPASQLGQESANAGPHLLAMMELPEGTTLRSDTYRLERVLGQGGFGITYFGQEMALQRPVAIKEHFPYGSTRDGLAVGHGILTAEEYHASLQRFARESRLLAQFDHPSIVHVLTVFEEAHTSYLVMEYVAGLSLEQLLTDQGKIEPERAAGYVGQACQALQIVHERGLLHRDIKPSNLLLRPEGRLVVIDFGSAREADLRKATAIVSAGYSPPELYSQGGVFGPRTDIYALGATLYHLITGQPPLDCLQRLMGETLQPFDDPRLWVVAERALRMDPQERFASMAEFLSALAPPGITQVIPSPSLPVLAPPSVEAVPAVPAGWGASGVATLVGHRGWIRALAFSPDGKFLASGSEDKSVRIWSEDGQLVTTLTGHTGWVYGLLFSEDGSVLYTAGYDRQLLAWNTASWQRVAQERCCEAIQCLSGWGVWLAVGTLSGKLELRRLPQLTLLRTLKLPGAVTSCAFAQGNLAATAGDDRIYLIDIEQGVVLERLKGHQGTVRVLQVLNDGRLISGGADRAVRIWDLDHGQSLPWSGGHQGTVLALIPIAGGLVSASGDKSVRIWNLYGDSRELGRHHGEVSALAATGDWVASGGQDNVVRLWPGRPP